MGPVVAWDASRPRLNALLPAGFNGIAVITGFVGSDRDGAADDARPQRQRLLGVDLRRAARRDGDPHLDRRRRRAERPTRAACRTPRHRRAVVQRGDGARVLRREGDSPADDGAGRRPRHPDLDPQHVRAREAGHADLRDAATRRSAVKGITASTTSRCVNLEGAGMIGVPGTADRLFGALREAGVSVDPDLAGQLRALDLLRDSRGQAEHARRGRRARVRGASSRRARSRASSVTTGLRDPRGRRRRHGRHAGRRGASSSARSARPASTCARSRRARRSATSPSSSTRRTATRALRAVHASFYLSRADDLDRRASARARSAARCSTSSRAQARGCASDSTSICACAAIVAQQANAARRRSASTSTHWRDALAGRQGARRRDASSSTCSADHLPHAVLIDCTASEDVADRYAEWLGRGIHVDHAEQEREQRADRVLPRPRAREPRGAHALPLRGDGRRGPAGHPDAASDLVETGDEIRSIEGIFSGTLAYLFNVFDGKRAFSEIVREAKARGYTEPDPRDDLSGMDVARKLVILARETGLDARARRHRGREPRAGRAREGVASTSS